ncbi:hypothetical protein ABOM_000275 [Aspergillus bombycis]|uniref:ABC multidrug transporter MDR2 n=1 Tax=Aspergillus bombycis TaxID=109264 RepID=A0A1F8AGX6_9EURO|nr:hypothetical protein ABOM_000275 [Aspergillus bombycis]OGM51003.1 hypothetical protein ABOM_000275 [Aspergillus bombycis]
MTPSQVEMNPEEHKQAVLERQLNGLPSDDRGRSKIATYATKLDRTILCISSACAIIAGALNPLVPVIYGLLVGVFNGFATGSVDAAELRSKISTFSLYYVYLSIGLFVFTYLATVGFYYSGERITRAFRIAYLSAILRQNMAFFDILRPGEISNRIMSDMGILQEAITSKASTMLSAIATFCAAFIIAFVMYWKTALILTPFFVAMLLMFSVGGAYTVKHQKQSREKYSYAAGIPEEAFGAIRQVAAFGMQNFLRERYSLSLGQAARAERKAQNMVAGLVASMNAMPCLIYALSFWAGSIFLVKGEMSVTDITTTTLAVTIGVFAIIRIAPSLQALTSGIAITESLLETIARRSPQDPLVADGDKLTSVEGDILFDHVDLVYPSRSQAKVLDHVTLKFAADKKTAIVGPSGGAIDGQDIQTLNLRWLRQQIGLVDQDPILLDVSILDNIYYGCSNVNDAASESARLEKVVDAAKKAYAHDFIMALPEGYQTRVGEKGLQLSGGQRQRIAIARALVRDPKILLLDEATSALDTSSEKGVQAAIDAAAEQRTTIIIAHRLSTIRNADSIVVLAQGKVVDQGTHIELMARNGLYADLIEKQQIKENGQDASSSLHSGDDEGIIMLNDTPDHDFNSDDEKNGASFTCRVVEKPKDTSYNPSAKGALSFIFFMSRPDWKLLLIGLACAILAGLEIPV